MAAWRGWLTRLLAVLSPYLESLRVRLGLARSRRRAAAAASASAAAQAVRHHHAGAPKPLTLAEKLARLSAEHGERSVRAREAAASYRAAGAGQREREAWERGADGGTPSRGAAPSPRHSQLY